MNFIDSGSGSLIKFQEYVEKFLVKWTLKKLVFKHTARRISRFVISDERGKLSKERFLKNGVEYLKHRRQLMLFTSRFLLEDKMEKKKCKIGVVFKQVIML